MKIETNTLLFLIALLASSVLVFIFAGHQVDAWKATLITLFVGGGGALLPPLFKTASKPRPKPRTTSPSEKPADDDN